ncbi:serpin family protein [Streptomyces sp. NPDC051907]|uniref:serpin family protein n=1 Tax=Streptomyces sp. NPDC051907 TaxID=3155284 RepID=UPI003425562E
MRLTSSATKAATDGVNRLTARWAAELEPTAHTVFSAAGVWPLLALMLDGADGPARAELEAAVGVPAQDAAQAALELLAALDAMEGVRSAVGLWAAPGLPLREEWSGRLPAGALGRFSGDQAADQRALDAWAHDRTDGMIESMPAEAGEDTELVLAAAQAVRTQWAKPFAPSATVPASGPWAGREVAVLSRTATGLEDVSVAATADGPLTVVTVRGGAGVDVRLLLGAPDAGPSAVLQGGLAAHAGACPTVPGDGFSDGSPGPGLEVRTVEAHRPDPTLALRTMPFDLTAGHDLLLHGALFGLTAAMDATRGHFPGISARPLAVGSARQSAMASFDARGFRAASVTAIAARAGSAPPPRAPYTAQRVQAVLDRPFGFLTVHRASGLVLTAGWIAEPTPASADARARIGRPPHRPGGER